MQGVREGNDLTRAIASGGSDEINHAVDELLARVRRGRDPAEAIAAIGPLKSARRFDALLRVADSSMRFADADHAWTLRLAVVTALIELDATFTAEELVRALLADPASAPWRGRLLARLGQIKKDEYTDSRDPAALAQAIGAYVDAYSAGTKPLWTGVNAIALRALAARSGLAPDAAPPIDINDLLALATATPLPRGAWSIAAEIELRLARGESPESMAPLVQQLFDAADGTGFVFANLARQLDDVWDVDPSHPLMVMLGARTLADGRGEVILPRGPDGYERTFGTEVPVPIELYEEGLTCARSVGSLLIDGVFSVGTVFALRGADLHGSLDGETVLVTNEHVVPDPARGERKPQADEMEAHFDGVAGVDGTALKLADLRAIWRSPREDLDITLLLTADPEVKQLAGLDLADSLPPLRDGAYVYVIGHPGGAGLQLSIRGNDLIDEDDTRLHYKAPTARGSSGSPVFDQVWKLIGVHHKGSTELPALNGAPGTYAANEGIALQAIRDRIAEHPPEL